MAEGQSRNAGASVRRTQVCRHCGALVGAGEARCMMCGTPVAPPAEAARTRAERPDPETLRFLRAVVSRPATFTFVFIVANVFVYFLMWLSGGATGEVLLAYGAKRNDLIQAGQWWRFVAPIFLHVHIQGMGPLHLVANMYGLFMLGPYVEKLYGSAKFVVFWVVTGVAGVAASYLTVRPALAQGAIGQFLFKAYDTPSAGASGALFGLVGVLFVFGLKYRHELPEGLKRAFGTGMLPTILINLFIGYAARGFIDNAAHLGGLMSGMALALVIDYKRPGASGAVPATWHALQVACLALVVLSFVMVARHFDAPPPRLSNITSRPPSAQEPPAISPGVAAFVAAIKAGQDALAKFADGDGGELAPAIEKLGKTPSLTKDADALRDDLKDLLVRARDINSQPLARAERDRRIKQLDVNYTIWEKRLEHWAEGEGKSFGLTLEKTQTPEGQKPPEGQKGQTPEEK
ncbi:MAG TPA: rhomboid family intramembrane serine protease [Pyrinomonadaceae bacterium]|nr:rhomboid family intramembrane serine protease [Pyrinomonadaceae bacterium]